MRELVRVGLCVCVSVQYCKQEPKCKSYNKFAEIRNVLMNPPVLYVSGCVRTSVRQSGFCVCVCVNIVISDDTRGKSVSGTENNFMPFYGL